MILGAKAGPMKGMTIWKRKRFWAALAILAILAVFLAFRLATSKGLDQELEAWRKEGLPTNWEELDKWYPSVPQDKNAATYILQARDALVTVSGKGDPTTFELGKKISPEELDGIRDYLRKNKEALELVDEAAKFEHSRYPIQLWRGFATLVPHLGQIKGLSQLLKIKAIYHSSQGETSEAVRALHDNFALARSLRDEPILISELVRIACVAINLTALERVISEHQLPKSELETVLADVEQSEADGRRSIVRVLVGERANASFIFRSNFSEFNAVGGAPGASQSGPQQVFGNVLFTLYKTSGLRHRDARIYLRTMNGIIKAATNEFPASLKQSAAIDDERDRQLRTGLGRFAIMSRMMLPALSKPLQKEAALAARLRSARMALAVEMYRNEHGALPNSLADLGISTLTDPFGGTPLAFERKQSGYQIAGAAASKAAGTKNIPIAGFTVAR